MIVECHLWLLVAATKVSPRQLCWFMTKVSKLFIDPGLRTDDQIFTICLGLAKDELKAQGRSDLQ